MEQAAQIDLLESVTVLDFSQFLSGSSASLRLADMGARVIKVERPVSGDICRTLYVSNVTIAGESTIFHAINRNKESYAADLKNEEDLAKIKTLVAKADILIHNFRPGVMERLGLSYAEIQKINPSLVYGSINGYGTEGEWKDKPGQDLLLQAVSGLCYLTGNKEDAPTPMGVAVADILSGTHLVQGILAAYFQRLKTGNGALVELSMLESLLDFQFEVLTCYYNDGNKISERSAVNNGHAYLPAPYGVYKTEDGHIALAMAPLSTLATLLGADSLRMYNNPHDNFNKRDEIKNILQALLLTKPTTEWLSVLEPADIWCANVYDFEDLVNVPGYQTLNMEQRVQTEGGWIKTTRCPIRVDGHLLTSTVGAPALGQHNESINAEFFQAPSSASHADTNN